MYSTARCLLYIKYICICIDIIAHWNCMLVLYITSVPRLLTLYGSPLSFSHCAAQRIAKSQKAAACLATYVSELSIATPECTATCTCTCGPCHVVWLASPRGAVGIWLWYSINIAGNAPLVKAIICACYISGRNSSWTPGVFYTHFYNHAACHAHRPRLEKLL